MGPEVGLGLRLGLALTLILIGVECVGPEVGHDGVAVQPDTNCSYIQISHLPVSLRKQRSAVVLLAKGENAILAVDRVEGSSIEPFPHHGVLHGQGQG